MSDVYHNPGSVETYFGYVSLAYPILSNTLLSMFIIIWPGLFPDRRQILESRSRVLLSFCEYQGLFRESSSPIFMPI